MKKSVVSLVLSLLIIGSSSFAEDYVVMGWNDLGMHCSNKDFSTLVILPPYNNITAQVVRVGNETQAPAIVTANLYVTYEIPGNTYSIGKTDFWDFEDQLFGVNLPPDVGLTGNGLSGELAPSSDHFEITGVPLTPFQDADLVHEDPYQLGLLKVYDLSDLLLTSTTPVVPVSNEINCVGSGCHASEQAILNQHDEESGFNPNDTPILCADCHASNALGAPGNPNLPSLSEAVHKQHGERTNDCYKCHPGPSTECLRGTMSNDHNMICQDCHGSVTEVGESISDGREPWFDEPSCGAQSCHGSEYAEEPGKLFRESKGHGGLYCSACHGSPHAILPSREERDNLQNIALQGFAGTLRKCEVCHGVIPTGPGPHGLMASQCCANPGDINEDTFVNILDIIFLIEYKFKGGPDASCHDVMNVNDDTDVNILDIIYLIDFKFKGGPAPSCPV